MKKILALVLAPTLMYSCSQSLEDKKQDLEKKLFEIQATILENPQDYEDVIDKVFLRAYELKLEAVKEYPVRTGYVDPRDFLMRINKSQEGVYISIFNKTTQELLDLVYIENTTHLGDFDHRFDGLKQESKKIIYDKTKGVGKTFDTLSKKWRELGYLFGDIF